MNDNCIVIKPDADHRRNLGAAQHFFENGSIDRAQHQPMRGVVGQLQPAVACHRLGDVDQQRVRHRVAAVLQQRVDNLFCVVPGGPRVPETQRREAVGMHVLRRSLEFGEGRDSPTAFPGQFVVDLKEQGLVGLHDQRSVSH